MSDAQVITHPWLLTIIGNCPQRATQAGTHGSCQLKQETTGSLLKLWGSAKQVGQASNKLNQTNLVIETLLEASRAGTLAVVRVTSDIEQGLRASIIALASLLCILLLSAQ